MTEDPMEKVEQKIRERFKGFAKHVAENDGAGVERRKMARIAPILTHFSVKRQEAVLNGMKDQSDAMTQHSQTMIRLTKAMFWLTLAILGATCVLLFRSGSGLGFTY